MTASMWTADKKPRHSKSPLNHGDYGSETVEGSGYHGYHRQLLRKDSSYTAPHTTSQLL